jgi:thioredoxin reductase (NADPH)
MEEATALSKYTEKVILIHRKEEFRASSIMQERVKANPKIQCRMACVTEEILGKDHVEGIRIKNVKSGETEVIPCDGVFVALGHVPNTEILRNIMTLDERGYPVHNTAPEGLFFAGDCADPEYRQAITATSSGCQAAMDAEKYLNSLHQ